MRSTWGIDTMVLPEQSQCHIQHAKQSTFDLCGVGANNFKKDGGINLNIELKRQKLDQIDARKMRTSLNKRITFSK